MALPKQRIQVLAGSPIEVGDRKLLPSVLTARREWTDEHGGFFFTRMRPISFVAQGPEGNEWHEIPNATTEILSVMAAVGAGVAAICFVGILAIRWLRG
ncbi:MAG: hypothetical protein GVY30_03235 [Chloroflexi bacterium]|jgi:hypothetical protein|nr:hypothetical protein [Chloroflexota bacterium]